MYVCKVMKAIFHFEISFSYLNANHLIYLCMYVCSAAAGTCLGNFGGRCAYSTDCCDPGAFCDLTSAFPQCQQPAQNSGMCRNPTGF